MNLPNKLTMARIIMIPIFLVLLLCPLGLDSRLHDILLQVYSVLPLLQIV